MTERVTTCTALRVDGTDQSLSIISSGWLCAASTMQISNVDDLSVPGLPYQSLPNSLSRYCRGHRWMAFGPSHTVTHETKAVTQGQCGLSERSESRIPTQYPRDRIRYHEIHDQT